jgi:hypothetical protein
MFSQSKNWVTIFGSPAPIWYQISQGCYVGIDIQGVQNYQVVLIVSGMLLIPSFTKFGHFVIIVPMHLYGIGYKCLHV